MANFVAICSKNGQRVELSLVRANIEDAKAELHNQGYAIIEIREAAESVDQAGNSLATFYFDILVEGKQKSGQIKSSDSFRAYIKLVDDLHYQVLAIYDNPSATEEERRFFTNKIREMYAVYKERNKGGAKPTEEPQSGKAKPTEADESRSGSLMERQVAKYHALIEKVVLKVEFLAANYSEQLGEDRLFRLKELITALKQLKNIQNLDKLRIVGEAALEKVGQLEVEFIEKGYIREKKDTLKDTNALLKGIGSSKRIILPEDDFVVQVKVLWKGFRENYLSKAASKASSQAGTSEISTNEFLYFKNVRELKAYESKRAEINHELLRGMFSLKGEKRDRLVMKRKMIEQNIELLSSRIKNRSVSYVKLKRGATQYSESFFYLCRSFGDFFAYSVFAYAVVFSVAYPVFKLVSGSVLPHRYVFAFAAISFVAFCLKQARSWVSF